MNISSRPWSLTRLNLWFHGACALHGFGSKEIGEKNITTTIRGVARSLFQTISSENYLAAEEHLKREREYLSDVSFENFFDDQGESLGQGLNIEGSTSYLSTNQVKQIQAFAEHSLLLTQAKVHDYFCYRLSLIGTIVSSGVVLLSCVTFIPSVLTFVGVVGLVLSTALAVHTCASPYFIRDLHLEKARSNLPALVEQVKKAIESLPKDPRDDI